MKNYIQMQKIRLHWEFYKSTLILNLSISVFLSFIMLGFGYMMPGPPPSFLVIYMRCLMFGGPAFCLYYKEVSRKNEFYFYYNRGISKISLFLATYLIYILFGTLTLNILHYAKLT